METTKYTLKIRDTNQYIGIVKAVCRRIERRLEMGSYSPITISYITNITNTERCVVEHCLSHIRASDPYFSISIFNAKEGLSRPNSTAQKTPRVKTAATRASKTKLTEFQFSLPL
jgi:hypothetical protein